MKVYRITLSKFTSLKASGRAARWNSRGVEMIYTSSTLSLACLENIVHRKDRGLTASYRTIIIDIPDAVKKELIKVSELPEKWYEFDNDAYEKCSLVGDEWINNGSSAVLQVPSAIIKTEFNYLINPNHPDFKRVKIVSIEPFSFDPRVNK